MKLEGIKVVDLSQFLPGPQMTAMMADHGADVLKVEPPAGDPSRQMAPFEAGQSVWFRTTNRGKRSVTLDLKSDVGLSTLYDLVKDADVFVEAFRPGVAKRLGVDYPTLSGLNPRLVYCSISAFGQDGPLADHPAHDMAVEALLGFMSVNDDREGVPVVPAVPAADMAASLTALSGVLMALIGRDKTGRGDYLDIAMFDSLAPWSGHIAGPAFAEGRSVRSSEQRSLGGAAFYQVYETADDRYLVLAGREEKFVRNLLNALSRPDLIEASISDAGAPQHPVIQALSEIFRTRTLADWIQWFNDKNVCFAPVLDFVEAFESEQMIARGMMLIGPDGQHLIGSSIKFLHEPGAVSFEAPILRSNDTNDAS